MENDHVSYMVSMTIQHVIRCGGDISHNTCEMILSLKGGHVCVTKDFKGMFISCKIWSISLSLYIGHVTKS